MVETYKQKFNKKFGFEKNASHSIREIASKAGISYRNALKIVEKGRGAHRSNPESVRSVSGKKVGGKSLKGKMSATQWAYSRLYSAVMGGPAAKVDKDLLK
jgi:molybdenum-dependent DNA-binding transcriptional regulator ModE